MTPRLLLGRALLVGATVCAAAAPARAQLCTGRPALAPRRLQTSVGAAFTSGQQTFDAGVRTAAAGAFFGGTVAAYNLSALDAGAFGIGGTAGAPLPVGAPRLRVCPLVSVSARFGPTFHDVVEIESHGVLVTAGAQAAVFLPGRGRLRVAPTFGAAVAHARETLVGHPVIDETAGVTFALIEAGVGLLLGERVSVVPQVRIPMARAGADPEFSVSLAVTLR